MAKASWHVRYNNGWYAIHLGPSAYGCIVGYGEVGAEQAEQAAEWLNHYRHFNS